MGSVVQKLRSLSLLLFIAACFTHRFSIPFEHNVLAADPVAEKTNKETEPLPVAHEPSISLERRLDRSSKIIEFKRTMPDETLEPIMLRLDYEIRSFDTSQTSVVSLINGLIQRITMDKDTYHQGEIANLNITVILHFEDPEINFLYRTYNL